MANAAVLMDFQEDARRAMDVLSKAMNSFRYIYNADLFDFEKLQEVDDRKSLYKVHGSSLV